MPSTLHEVLVALIREDPALAASLLTDLLGLELPPYQDIRLDSGELTQTVPTEYRADAVVVLTQSGKPVLGIIVEVQLRPEPGKQWSWPSYLVSLRSRLRCPVVLLVICPSRATATRCAPPIRLGPGSVVTPMVLGPDDIPIVDNPDTAIANPGLAVLSAIAYSAQPARDSVLNALAAALFAGTDEGPLLYADVVLAVLPLAARHYLEKLMATGTYEYKSDFARRYHGQGKAEGRAEGETTSLLVILEARRIPVDDTARAKITACTDLDMIQAWLRRSVSINSVDELFTD